MILQLKYFGMIAEALNKESEELNLDVSTASELTAYFYDKLKGMSFKIAANHQLVNADYQFKENDEVALLPPFAGG